MPGFHAISRPEQVAMCRLQRAREAECADDHMTHRHGRILRAWLGGRATGSRLSLCSYRPWARSGLRGSPRASVRPSATAQRPARSAAVLGDAVPASSSRGTIVGSWWFGSIVRTVLALLALMALAFAGDRYVAFDLEFQLNFRRDTWLWLSWIGAAGAAGILFGLATWLPLTRVRYAWSRLLLAAVPLVPLAQFWWVEFYQFPRHGEAGGWLVRAAWLWDPWEQFALATLAGVAIASGFRAKGSEAFSAAE